MQTLITKSTK